MVAGYAVLTTLYSFWLKQIAVIDLVVLSAGFILRLLGGAYAAERGGVGLVPGHLAVRIALHRRGEAPRGDRGAGRSGLDTAPNARRVQHRVPRVSRGRWPLPARVISYCLWAVESGSDSASTAVSALPWAQLSIIPFLIAVLRYALMVDQGKGSAPEDVILHDRQMQLMGVLLVVCIFVGVYL